ncbi:MAG: ATP-binding protein [Candidatus Caldarchaeum sp.]
MVSLGIVVGRSSPNKVSFISSRPVRVGEYVTVDAPEGTVLYMVERTTIESRLLSEVRDYITAEEAKKASSLNPRDKTLASTARALGLFQSSWSSALPSIPPEPGSIVKEAADSLLRSVYHVTGDEWVEVGRLLRRPSVPVTVNLNKLASRHLAILATTGKGKSNLLALLAKKIAEKNGTMVIFDYHSEYGNLKIEKINMVKPRINPRRLDSEQLADLLDVRSSAEKQRALLTGVFTRVRQRENFWEALRTELNNMLSDEGKDSVTRQTAARVLEIVDRALLTKGVILDERCGTPLEILKKNRINVVDLSELTEHQAQIILGHFLIEILNDRKNAVFGYDARFTSPVVVAVEEAHLFIPAGVGRSECADVVSRVAREGRKFGVGLVIVSQRPNRLDPDVVSQMGSFAISGLSYPEDQRFVMTATDFVSDELGVALPCLNTGEMILAGQWVAATTLAMINRVEEKLVGRDIDAVKEWKDDRNVGSKDHDPDELIKP